MTNWARSLIRLSGYEVETLQKRLAEITTRRASAEVRVAVLDAEYEVERERSTFDAHAAMQMSAYVAGWRLRKAAAEAEFQQVWTEEEGARDALALAFEAQKKFEQVAEMARVRDLAETSRRETQALDELALRRATA